MKNKTAIKCLLIWLLLSNAMPALKAQSVGGITSGATTFCDSVNSGFISLSGHIGNVLNWQYSTNKGLNWVNIPNTTSTQSYNKLIKTTSFRAVVKSGAFIPDTSSAATVVIRVPGVAGTLQGGGVFCASSGNGTLQLKDSPGNVLYWENSVNHGNSWGRIENTASSLAYSNLIQNTFFRAIVQTSSVCPNDTSSLAGFTIHPPTGAGAIFNSDTLCYGAEGDTLQLKGNVGAILDWFWSNDNGVNWHALDLKGPGLTYSVVTQTIWYKATSKSGICPEETTAPAVISVYNTSPANAGDDITITQFDKVTLNGTGNGTPGWSPDCLEGSGSFSPLVSPFNTTTYVLSLTDSYGCKTSDSVRVQVIIPVPTAITPNGDGVNDLFRVDKIEQYEQSSLIVFNRWGSVVYKKAPYNNQWNGVSMDGRDLPDDTYYYILDFGNGEKPTTNYLLLKR